MKGAALLLLAAFVPVVQAAEFDVVEVHHDGDVYSVHAEARIDASEKAIRSVITDYRHMHWITGAVLESEILERPAPHVAVISVRSRACFGMFCKTIEQVQRADASQPDRVVFITLPGRGDLKAGRSEWRLQPLGPTRTKVTWDMSMEPDFWVPWLIGPGLIESGLADEGQDMINGIEKLANERETRQ